MDGRHAGGSEPGPRRRLRGISGFVFQVGRGETGECGLTHRRKHFDFMFLLVATKGHFFVVAKMGYI